VRRSAAVLSFRVSPELKAELQKLADADQRKLAPYVVIVLKDHIAAKKAAAKRK
jgi:predicted transcriptional regulator